MKGIHVLTESSPIVSHLSDSQLDWTIQEPLSTRCICTDMELMFGNKVILGYGSRTPPEGAQRQNDAMFKGFSDYVEIGYIALY